MIASTMKMITSHFAMSIEGHAMLVTPLAVARFIYEREPSVEAFAISLLPGDVRNGRARGRAPGLAAVEQG